MLIGNNEFNLGERTFIMGILNITPDSFSDGGRFNEIETAVKRAKDMILQGADIIDIGGESTRPGGAFVSEEEEIKRVVPIIKALKNEIAVPISIDTYKSAVAEAAIIAGASLINDVWGFKRDNNMANIASKYDVAVCLMHNRDNREYKELIPDMISDLKESIEIALMGGVKRERIILDPGIGFAKEYEDNLKVMKNLEIFKCLGYPMLLGTSRKSMIGLTLDLPVNERVEGTLATTTIGIIKGYDFVRVHDIKENKRIAIMTDAIVRGE